MPAVNGLGNGCFDENAHYYYSEAETGTLYMLDLSTGQTSLFSDALCEWAVQHIWGDGNVLYTGSSRQLSVAGGRLLVQVDARLDPEDFSGAPVPGRLFAFPLSGGQPEEVTLMDFYNGYAHPLIVQAETPAGFLVVGDRPSVGTAVLHGQDGGSYSMEVFKEHLALISPCRLLFVQLEFPFFRSTASAASFLTGTATFSKRRAFYETYPSRSCVHLVRRCPVRGAGGMRPFARNPLCRKKGRPDAAVSSVRPYPRTTEYVPGDNVVYFNGTSGSTPLVCYLDLESLQAHVLCSVEGCTHSTQACPAYGGGHLFLTPDALYSYRSCDASYLELGSAPALGTLRVHALDGSESHEVAKVDDGWTLGMFAQSDTAIYGTLGSDLAMLELATGHETILQRNFTQNNYFDNYHLAQIGNDLLLPVWVGNPLKKVVFLLSERIGRAYRDTPCRTQYGCAI